MPRTAPPPAEVAELLEVLNAVTRLTEIVNELRGLQLNNVVWSGTVTLDANGIATRSTQAPFASVGARALDAGITVVAEGPGSAAPTDGIGVIPLGAGEGIVWPLTGTVVTVYGTAGDRVLLTLWSAPQCPMIAMGGNVDGGGA